MEFNGLVSKRVGRNANPFMFFNPLVQQKIQIEIIRRI